MKARGIDALFVLANVLMTMLVIRTSSNVSLELLGDYSLYDYIVLFMLFQLIVFVSTGKGE